MTDSAQALLTREEIDAVLAAAAASGPDDPRVRRDAGATEGARFVWNPLARALRELGDTTSRSLSALFQRTISLAMIDLRSLPADDFAAAMLSSDAPALLRFAPSGQVGAVLVGRTLVYGWLTLRFGGDLSKSPLFVPGRRYTPIERRQVQRAAAELVDRLPKVLATIVDTQLEIGPIVEPDLLAAEVSPRLWVASYEARGFGELGRLRIALPDALFARARDERATGRVAHAALGDRLREMPVRVSAEVGTAELPLGQLRALRVGDVLALKASAASGVLVRVEGQPKFRGVRGQIGAQLAVRITERV